MGLDAILPGAPGWRRWTGLLLAAVVLACSAAALASPSMTMGGPPGSSIASAGDAPMSMNCDDECVTEMAGACGGVALLVVLTLLLPRRGGRHLFARSGAPARDAVPPGLSLIHI